MSKLDDMKKKDKKTKQIIDIIKEANKQSREEEILLHNGFVKNFGIQKSKKVYSRNKKVELE
jgi:hypothetical protein